jgi:flagellar motor protein MotB
MMAFGGSSGSIAVTRREIQNRNEFDVDEARLSTEGLGEARPIATNATPEGRRANRRVEVVILD